MNRKSFLKSLLVVPFIPLLDVKKVFAKNEDIFVSPNPFKSLFSNFNCHQIKYIKIIIEPYLRYKKIRSLEKIESEQRAMIEKSTSSKIWYILI